MRKLRGLAFGYTQAPVPVTTFYQKQVTILVRQKFHGGLGK